jgi:hypothetical protein
MSSAMGRDKIKTYNESLVMVLKLLLKTSSLSVSSHSFTKGPFIYRRSRVAHIFLEKSGSTVAAE